MKLVAAFGTLLLLGAGGGILYDVLRSQPALAQTKGGGKAKSSKPTLADTQESPGSPPRYVAKVNGDLISHAALVEACVERYGKEVLENLINRHILEQACAAKGIQISQADIDAEIDQNAKVAGLTREQILELYKSERDVPPNMLVREIIWPRLALKRLAGEGIQVTDKELKESFEANFGPRVKARMIMADDERRARELWQKAKTAIDTGKPQEFQRLAMNHSTDPVSRPLAGMIQPIRRHLGMPQLEQEAFRLKEGELSKVVQVGTKYVMLLCEGRTDPVKVSFDEVRQQLYDDIYDKKLKQAVSEIFVKLRSDSKIDNYLNPEASKKVGEPAVAQQPKQSPVVPASGQKQESAGSKTGSAKRSTTKASKQ